MLARDLRGFGAARIDHHQGAARSQGLQPLGDAGGSHQAAVGGDRVGAQHQEEVGAVDIRDRQQELVPVHARAGELVRPLVHRRGAVHVRRAQRLQQGGQVGDVAEVVDVRVAQVGSDSGRAVGLLQRSQARARQCEGVVPADRQPARALAAHRRVQPVGIGLQVEDGIALGADVAATEGIVRVAADRDRAVALQLQLEAADGLAQVAGPEHGCAHGDASTQRPIRRW